MNHKSSGSVFHMEGPVWDALHAGCPSCHPSNVKALKDKMYDTTRLQKSEFLLKMMPKWRPFSLVSVKMGSSAWVIIVWQHGFWPTEQKFRGNYQSQGQQFCHVKVYQILWASLQNSVASPFTSNLSCLLFIYWKLLLRPIILTNINKILPKNKNNQSNWLLDLGFVTSYNIRPGSRQCLLWFPPFLNLLLTYLIRHLPKLQPRITSSNQSNDHFSAQNVINLTDEWYWLVGWNKSCL